MRAILAYAALIHPYAVSVVVLTTIALALLAAGGLPAPGPLLRLTGVVLLSQICVGITNELHDLALDRLAKPSKPLVSGRAQPGVARVVAIVAAAGSLLLGLSFGWTGLLFAVAGTAAGLSYNYWLKGTALSWLPYAVGFSLLPLWPFVALDRWHPALGLLWMLVLPASVVLNLAQSLADIESDTRQGVRGLAPRLGRRLAPATMLAAAAITTALALLTGLRAGSSATLLLAAATMLGLVALATARCYLRPGPASWIQAWRLAALGTATLAVGWLAAVL